MLPIPGVARLADALVGLGGVLADGIDVAVVSALHALVNICKRTGEGSRGESLGPLPSLPMGATTPGDGSQQPLAPQPALTQLMVGSGHGKSLGPLQNSTTCVPS